MKFHHHPSAPHIICTEGSDRTFVSASVELTRSIAEAGKASLHKGTGTFSQAMKIRVTPPDMDSPDYSIEVEIPDQANTLEYGILRSIAALQHHLIENLAPLHLTLHTGEPPNYQNGWLSWLITPTQAASYRASFVAAQAAYQSLGIAANSNADGGGGLMDEYANTEEPSIAILTRQHLELCESLANSARTLAEWQDRKTEFQPMPWFDNDGIETDPDGKTYHTTTIAEQAASQAAALRRAKWQAEKLQALASL